MFDLKITGGTIVDGTGQAGFVGDVADRGAASSSPSGPTSTASAAEVIDAAGLIVAPGFVDIHTHYDGQATWDPVLDPSASHGVTTVVARQLRRRLRPVRPGEETRLVELMEGVEDIPGTALHEGIQWDWETFPRVPRRAGPPRRTQSTSPHSCRTRRCACTSWASAAPPTRTPRRRTSRRWPRHVRAAIEAGAVGFSTSRSLNHKALDGELVPGTFASADELVGLAQAVLDAGGGLFEVVPTGETGDDADLILGEVELMAEVSRRYRDRAVVPAHPVDGRARAVASPARAGGEGAAPTAPGWPRRSRPDPAGC